jgi:hypothetical protein
MTDHTTHWQSVPGPASAGVSGAAGAARATASGWLLSSPELQSGRPTVRESGSADGTATRAADRHLEGLPDSESHRLPIDLIRAAAVLRSADDLELRVMLRLEAQEAEEEAEPAQAAVATATEEEAEAERQGSAVVGSGSIGGLVRDGLFPSGIPGEVLARARELAALPEGLVGCGVGTGGAMLGVFMPESRVSDVESYVGERRVRDTWLMRARGLDGGPGRDTALPETRPLTAQGAGRDTALPETRPLTAQGAGLMIASHVSMVACRQAVREATSEVVDGLARTVVQQG